MTSFIFMLTRNDVTVPDAVKVFEGVRDTGVSFLGFKDVGLPLKEMERLVQLLKGEGRKVFFESVSLTKEGCTRSVETAIKLGVDYFIGGIYLEPVLKKLRRGEIEYFPYVGRAVGHPCTLTGSIEEVVGDARRAAEGGVSGINLLAYRYKGDVDRLLTSVKSAVDTPLLVAGDINSFERVNSVVELGAWGFTIGTAVFERRFSTSKDVADQIKAVMEEVEKRGES